MFARVIFFVNVITKLMFYKTSSFLDGRYPHEILMNPGADEFSTMPNQKGGFSATNFTKIFARKSSLFCPPTMPNRNHPFD